MEKETLIALYGEKPTVMQKLICEINQLINGSLPESIYKPYDPDQVHATLTGLESVVLDGKAVNKNILEKKGVKAVMDFSDVKDIVKNYFPMVIRFGGFSAGDSPFLSRAARPYERSFQLNTPTNQAVLMGWPHTKMDFSQHRLLNLRRELEQRCNIGHKYDEDNDFYLVLGRLEGRSKNFPEPELRQLENTIRDYLFKNPVDIKINSLMRVHYIDSRLPVQSTEILENIQFK